ncbi:unnamed protein product [Moneuplotes crassus]|uniref:Uncharacterized protein n=1 Tax=Euplotes crassus TaxID=5936 RepID=A0AAD1Y6C6_EUPCR|nr:unnamed protein product [Moneuplotes crassus]
MNQLHNLFPKINPSKNLNMMSNYDPHDINAEYEAVGSDLRQMATNAFTMLKKPFDPEFLAELDKMYVENETMMLFQC